MTKWTGKLAALALTLALWASPLMACVLPGSVFTAQGWECCRKMAMQCGQKETPSSHSCCKPAVHQTNSYVTKPRFTSAHPKRVAAMLRAGGNILPPASDTHAGSLTQAHGPPFLSAVTISILRI